MAATTSIYFLMYKYGTVSSAFFGAEGTHEYPILHPFVTFTHAYAVFISCMKSSAHFRNPYADVADNK